MAKIASRILRQLDAAKTGIAAPDECYVITHRTTTSEVVVAAKAELERDGLHDLDVLMSEATSTGSGVISRKLERRD